MKFLMTGWLSIVKKILIIGASGFIGGKAFQSLSKMKNFLVKGTYFSRKSENMEYLDVNDVDNVSNVFNTFKPNIILHPAYIPNVDYCEENKDIVWKTNVEGTRNVAKIAQKIMAKLVFFSSDYIFDGKNGPYSEDAVPSPISFYGFTKSVGENIVKCVDDNLILRMTVVYGWDPNSKNFIMQLINNLRNNIPMRVPTDQCGTPVLVDNLIDILTELIEKDKKGVYNIGGPDLVNRYEFAIKVAEIFNLDKSLIIPVDTKSLCQKALRPLKGGLKIDKAKKELKTRLLGIEEGLKIVKQQWENHEKR